jgi:hypothetical protein
MTERDAHHPQDRARRRLDALVPLPHRLDRRQPEVANADTHVLVQENVRGLEVAVNNVLGVEVPGRWVGGWETRL